MMKIAIAGTNGLAQFIAYYLSQITSHSFVFLTRTANPGLKERDWQMLVVSYDNPDSLAYTLKGVDVVISTIAGEAQLALIGAAVTAQVRRFIPSSFSGPEQCSPRSVEGTEWDELISVLDKSSMDYTVFTCGVFYERFGPGGLNALQISTGNNRHAAIGEEGKFLIDIRTGNATIPVISDLEEASICMTSARDVARYVVATLQAYKNLATWPREFKFCTQRLSMSQVLEICARVRGSTIIPTFTTVASLRHNFDEAQPSNSNEALSLAQYVAVAESHSALTFPSSAINLASDILSYARTPGTEPAPSEPFEEWLRRAWSTPAIAPSRTSIRNSADTSRESSRKPSRSASSQKSKRATPQ